MSSYELYLPPEKLERNAVTGRYMKGHVPHNKGKKWNDYTTKRAQRGMRKGWKNLNKHRPKTRPDNAGRCMKPVIAVLDNGKFLYFRYTGAAAEWRRGDRGNISRCCRLNERPLSPVRKKLNTDHRYKGVRWYYEDNDIIWTSKIKNP
jgi:hypothetical protein